MLLIYTVFIGIMGTHNFETSNIVLMIYKQLVIIIGIILLFLFGIDTARNYILPIEWKVTKMDTKNPAPIR
jgi:amino acid transporter